MQTSRELAQVLEHRLEVLLHAFEPDVRVVLFLRDGRSDALEVQPERDQPLLRPIVQIALDPLARLICRRDDARARGDQLGTRRGVRDRRRNQLRDAREPELGSVG